MDNQAANPVTPSSRRNSRPPSEPAFGDPGQRVPPAATVRPGSGSAVAIDGRLHLLRGRVHPLSAQDEGIGLLHRLDDGSAKLLAAPELVRVVAAGRLQLLPRRR
jgi:hypothetical protein